MDMQHGHGHAAWTWTCTMDVDMDMDIVYCWTSALGPNYAKVCNYLHNAEVGTRYFFPSPQIADLINFFVSLLIANPLSFTFASLLIANPLTSAY